MDRQLLSNKLENEPAEDVASEPTTEQGTEGGERSEKAPRTWKSTAIDILSWGSLAVVSGLFIAHKVEVYSNTRGDAESVTSPLGSVTCKLRLTPNESGFAEILSANYEDALSTLAKVDTLAATLSESGLDIEVCPPQEWTHSQNLPCTVLDDNKVLLNGSFFYSSLSGSRLESFTLDEKAEYIVVKTLPIALAIMYQNQLVEDLHAANIPEELAFSSDLLGCTASYECALRSYLAYNLSMNVAENIVHTGWNHSGHHSYLTRIEAYDQALSPADASYALESRWNLPSAIDVSSNSLTIAQVVSLENAYNFYSPNGVMGDLDYFDVGDLLAVVSGAKSKVGQVVENVQRQTLDQSLENIAAIQAGEKMLADTSFYFASQYSKGQTLICLDELAAATSGVKFDKDDPVLSEVEAALQKLCADFKDDCGDRELTSSRNLEFNYGVLKVLRCFPDDSPTKIQTYEDIKKGLFQSIEAVCEAPASIKNLHSYSLHISMLSGANEAILLLKEMGELSAAQEQEYLDRLSVASASIEYTAGSVVRKDVLSRLTPLLPKLNSVQSAWVEHALIRGGVRVEDNVYHGFAGRGHGVRSFNLTGLDATYLFKISPDAQTALLKCYSNFAPGNPRHNIYDVRRGYFDYVSSATVTEKMTHFAFVVKDLPAIEQTLLCEAYASLPYALREIDTETLDDGTEAPLIRGLLGSNLTNGPLAIAARELTKRDVRFSDVDLTTLLTKTLPTEFPYLAWAPNVSVLTSSTSDEVSWGGFYDYGYKLREEMVEHSDSFINAHSAAYEYCDDLEVTVSTTSNWLLGSVEKLITGSQQSDTAPGTYNQHPQIHRGEIIPEAGPEVALVLYGKNAKYEFLGDRFRSDAKSWKSALERAYKSDVQMVRPKSASEFSDAIESLKELADTEKDLLIVISGHGLSSETDEDNVKYLVDVGGGFDLGEVSLGGSFDLTEIALKNKVNRELSPLYRSITIIVDSCHSGSWSQ